VYITYFVYFISFGDKVEFNMVDNTVDFVESRPCGFGPEHTGDKDDRIGIKVELYGNSRLCCRFVAGFGNSRLSTKSTMLN